MVEVKKFFGWIFIAILSLVGAQARTWFINPDEGTTNCSQYRYCDSLNHVANSVCNDSSNGKLFLLFLPGTHLLSTNLNLFNKEEVTLKGLKSTGTTKIICNALTESGIIISMTNRTHLRHIQIEYCGTNSGQSVNVALYVNHVSYILMADVGIKYSSGCGLFVQESEMIQLKHCNFDSNSGSYSYLGGNAKFIFSENASVTLIAEETNFTGSVAYSGNGEVRHAAGVHISSNAAYLNVSFKRCHLVNNTKRNMVVDLAISKLSTFTSVSIINSSIMSGEGRKGAGLSYYITPANSNMDDSSCNGTKTKNILNIDETIVADNHANQSAGGILLHLHDIRCSYNVVTLHKCAFFNNSINSNTINHSTGAALLIMRETLPKFGQKLFPSNYYIAIKNCNFTNNVIFTTKGAIVEFINSRNAELSNCVFSYNSGTALSLHSSSVILSKQILFHNNSATFGGALQLCETSFFFINNFTTVVFKNNFASQKGGAIYMHKTCLDKHSFCFFQPITTKTTSITHFETESRMKLEFANNTAAVAGYDIYGGNIDICYTYATFINNSTTTYSHYLSHQIFNAITEFLGSNKNMSISSDPYIIQICSMTSHKDYRTIWPGYFITTSLQLLGQRHGFTSGQIDVTTDDDRISLRRSPTISSNFCKEMNITIYTKYTEIVSTLNFQVQNSITIEDIQSATLEVHIEDCPWGFYLNKTTESCECNPFIESHRCKCTRSKPAIKCSVPIHWVGCDSETFCDNKNALISLPCPKNYCNESAEITADHINGQCTHGRTGRGCGKCIHNYSAVLGTSDCKECSNSYLWLVTIYLLSGIFLILLLMKLDITVANGTINGVIFYANFVYINKDIFFPEAFSNQNVLRIIISWLNLDLGIEVCFYNGMTTYQKIWIQFAYILYIWSLQIVIICLCRKYIYFTRICGRNVTKAMATLTLISFMKCLNVIQAIAAFLHLTSSTGTTLKVWQPNPSITFASAKHMPQLIAAALLGTMLLSFTLCLLLIHPLKKTSGKKGFAWVSRLQPFFDAFTGPCNSNYSFWPGFLFFIRIVLIVLHLSHGQFRSQYDKVITSCSITILIIVLSFLYPSGVYTRWSLNILELSIMVNLALLSGLVNIKWINISTRNKSCLTYVSAFFLLLSLLCYKSRSVSKLIIRLCLTLIKKLNSQRGCTKKAGEQMLFCPTSSGVTRSEIQVSIPPNESSRLLNVSSLPHVKSFHEPRESLLENDNVQ